QPLGALMATRTSTGKDMIQFPRQVLEFLGRKIGGRQACLFIGGNIIGESRMVGAGAERDMGLTVPDEQNTHGYDQKNVLRKLSPLRRSGEINRVPAIFRNS